MKPKKYQIYLSEEQRKELEGLTKRGKHSAATIKRANILLDLDENAGKGAKNLYSTQEYAIITHMEQQEFKATNYPSDLTDSQWEQIAEYFQQDAQPVGESPFLNVSFHPSDYPFFCNSE